MTKQKITGGNRALAYFAILPHIADDDLNVYEYRLYGHYLRVCGSYGERDCTEGVRKTAKTTQMSMGSVVKYRETLKNKGFITCKYPDDDTVHVSIVDRWLDNMSRYSRSSDEHPADDDDDTRSAGERPRSSGELNNNDSNNIGTILSKDSIDRAPDGDGDEVAVDFELTDRAVFDNLTQRAILEMTLFNKVGGSGRQAYEIFKAQLVDMCERQLVELTQGETGVLVKLSKAGVKAKYNKSDATLYHTASQYLGIYHDRLTRVHGASVSLNTIRTQSYNDAKAIAEHKDKITVGEFAAALDNFLASQWYLDNKTFISMRAISMNIHARVAEMRAARQADAAPVLSNEATGGSKWHVDENPFD